MNMEHYEEECIITFLNNQEKLLKERVAETQEEAEVFELPSGRFMVVEA